VCVVSNPRRNDSASHADRPVRAAHPIRPLPAPPRVDLQPLLRRWYAAAAYRAYIQELKTRGPKMGIHVLEPYAVNPVVRLPKKHQTLSSVPKHSVKSNHSLLKSKHSPLPPPTVKRAQTHPPETHHLPCPVLSASALDGYSHLIWRCCNSIPIFPFALIPRSRRRQGPSAARNVLWKWKGGAINLQGGAGPELDLHCTARTGRDGMGWDVER
jgi:hypothetical protein